MVLSAAVATATRLMISMFSVGSWIRDSTHQTEARFLRRDIAQCQCGGGMLVVSWRSAVE